MHRSVANLTIFQSILIAIWLITRAAPWFFAALGICLLTSVGMIIYLLVRWHQLHGPDRYEGIFAVGGWILIAWLVVRTNGLTVGSFWG